MKSCLVLCAALFFVITGCKKQNLPDKQTESASAGITPSTQRALGGVMLPPEEFEKLIDYSKLLTRNGTNKIESCSSVDLTSLFPLPGDQGLQGSCSAWAAAYIKSYWERNEIGWALNNSNHFFSPQYIYSQTHSLNSGDGGPSQIPDAFKLMVDQGNATLDVCPYDPNNAGGWANQPTQAMKSQAIKFRNSGWTALPAGDVNEMKARLCNNEPVALSITVYSELYTLNPSNDTYDQFTGALSGSHSIALIGYDDTRQAFKFINQWGVSWGVNGYAWISYQGIIDFGFQGYVMYNKPNAVYSDVWASTSTVNAGAYGYYSGDVNGDGNTDVIQPWSNGGTLAFIAHDISGAATSIICNNTMTGSGINSVGFAAGDFDGDGKADMIQGWKNGSSLALSVFKSNGSSISPFGTWTMPANYVSLKLLPVDMDGDGKTDIAQLWTAPGNKLGVHVFKSTGSSYVNSTATTFNEGAGNIGFIPADYDGDGKTDIIQFWNNAGSLGVIVYRSTGTSYYAAWSGTMPESSGNVGFAPVDYDGDGKVEFIQGWNDLGNIAIIAYHSDGSVLTSANNSGIYEGYQNTGLLPIKTAGESKTAFVQVFTNAGKAAFIRYSVNTYP